jgi:hypothetical protein
MKKVQKKQADGTAREYDFSHAVVGKYAQRYAAGTNVVCIDPRLAEVFPDSASVNRALRCLLVLAEQKARESQNVKQRKKGELSMSKHCNPGLDERCRDQDGRIREKNSHTRVDTLREIYGPDFAPGLRGDAHLRTLLDQTGAESLSNYLKHKDR